jgi:predicted metal-dependent phosphoesterase TrpH
MTARWYRGNLHTHTTNSDGDSPPDVVVAWYRDAGYDFLAVTDHDVLTDPDGLRDAAGPMTLIRGEEISSGDIHVNGLGIRERIAPTFAADVRSTIQGNVDAVRAQGGVPSVNHPNFRWMVSGDDLAALRDVRLFEIHNAGPEVNNLGGRPGFPSVEATWDTLLSADHHMLGVAVDDAHYFRVWGRQYSNPGRAWMCIRAERATPSELLAALDAGACYASTGVTLADTHAARGELAIDIEQQWELHYRTTFIGVGGRVLDVQEGLSARYRLSSTDRYVRARVDDSDGLTAWTQPLFRD